MGRGARPALPNFTAGQATSVPADQELPEAGSIRFSSCVMAHRVPRGWTPPVRSEPDRAARSESNHGAHSAGRFPLPQPVAPATAGARLDAPGDPRHNEAMGSGGATKPVDQGQHAMIPLGPDPASPRPCLGRKRTTVAVAIGGLTLLAGCHGEPEPPRFIPAAAVAGSRATPRSERPAAGASGDPLAPARNIQMH